MFRYSKNLHVINFIQYSNKYKYSCLSISNSSDIYWKKVELKYNPPNLITHRSLSRNKSNDRSKFIKKNDTKKKFKEMNLFKGIKILPNTEKIDENLGEELGGKLERG